MSKIRREDLSWRGISQIETDLDVRMGQTDGKGLGMLEQHLVICFSFETVENSQIRVSDKGDEGKVAGRLSELKSWRFLGSLIGFDQNMVKTDG